MSKAEQFIIDCAYHCSNEIENVPTNYGDVHLYHEWLTPEQALRAVEIEREDEQHRKWILEYLYDGLRKSDEQFKGQFKAAISWLEKQGEQKSVYKIEPKFHEGDFIVNKEGNVYKVVGVFDVIENEYRLRRLSDNGFIRASISVVDRRCHRWTIQDARDGTVQ